MIAATLKVAGEVQMKALSHDMGILRRDNDRLRAENERLRAALKETLPYVDGFMRMQDQRIDPPKDTYDRAAAVAHKAHAALADSHNQAGQSEG